MLSKSSRSRLKGKSSHRYYEAKLQRIISLEDARYAVVPEDTDADLIEDIEIGGTQVVKCSKGNKVEDIKDILKTQSDLRYSKRLDFKSMGYDHVDKNGESTLGSQKSCKFWGKLITELM